MKKKGNKKMPILRQEIIDCVWALGVKFEDKQECL